MTSFQLPDWQRVLRETTRPSEHVVAYEHVVPASTELQLVFGAGSAQQAWMQAPVSGRGVVSTAAPSDDFDEHAKATAHVSMTTDAKVIFRRACLMLPPPA